MDRGPGEGRVAREKGVEFGPHAGEGLDTRGRAEAGRALALGDNGVEGGEGGLQADHRGDAA
jgi:hypothetical protein